MSMHWRTERDADGLVWLHFDQLESPINTLSVEVLDELNQMLQKIEGMAPRGLIICSDKPEGFIAGADVKGFEGLSDAALVEGYIRKVHGIFQRLEELPCPSLALIHGYCLGGGLELALACRYRIASDALATRLGFPEVKLGIFPGFGGTVRSTRLLSVLAAMNLMLTGRTLSGRTAQKQGLVDLCVPQRQLKNAAMQLLQSRPATAKAPWWNGLLSSNLMRPLVASLLHQQVAKKANPDHYPAPFALIEHWKRHGGSAPALYQSEAEQVASLITGDTAQNLIRVFGLQEKLKGLSKDVEFTPRHIHVVGGGTMGGDIAAWCALKGLKVTLQDRGPEQLTRAVKRAHQLFRRKLKRRHLVQAASDRLMPDPKGHGVVQADIVIEAIFEDIEAKQSLFKHLEPQLKPDALLASNTSSIPLETLSEVLDDPGRLVGLHFFNPVAKMQLVEVVKGEQSDPLQVDRALAFCHCIDRLPLPVKSSPGFLVNRVLMPYLLEAVDLLEEVNAPELIDAAAEAFGMPMGPIELADTVGLDICLSVAEKFSTAFHTEVPSLLRQKVEQGQLGRKSGQGFYQYGSKGAHKTAKQPKESSLTPHTERMILRMLNEAVACLREQVVTDEDLLDAGMIFGTGFAPFRGGPMHYIHQAGPERLHKRLDELQIKYGHHFDANKGWRAIGV